MKKIIALLAMSILLASCGNTETMVEEETENTVMEETQAPAEEVLTEDEINTAIEELFNDIAE